MALLALIVVLLVVRPMMRRIFNPEGAAAAGSGPAALAVPGGTPGNPGGVALPAGGSLNFSGAPGGSITSAGGPNVSIVGTDQSVAISNRTSAMIDIAQVQGQVHAQSVQKVGELADRNPNETISIIRSWLHENAA
jgi:flagellar M-ring protein FliF